MAKNIFAVHMNKGSANWPKMLPKFDQNVMFVEIVLFFLIKDKTSDT